MSLNFALRKKHKLLRMRMDNEVPVLIIAMHGDNSYMRPS